MHTDPTLQRRSANERRHNYDLHAGFKNTGVYTFLNQQFCQTASAWHRLSWINNSTRLRAPGINDNSSSACLKQIYNIRCMCISLHAEFDEQQHICIYQNVYRHYAATSQVESTPPSLSLIRSTVCTESDMNWVTFTLGSTNRSTYLYAYIYINTQRRHHHRHHEST